MFLEKIKSEGLAHLSYILGDGGEAAVIDPRRDCQVYIDLTRKNGARIKAVFETHRNEDYVIGSTELARRAGALVYHGSRFPFAYGQAVREGETFTFGDLKLKVLETPGHTYESISLVATDESFGEEPVGVFTGDALFVGDVGRTDFFPEKAREVAGLLYDSIFDKILPLGDQAILYPAHGSGSVCGNDMASREFSTLGFEKRHNNALQKTDRDDFIKRKLEENHYIPPYFSMMEKHNALGAPPLEHVPQPEPATPEEFEKRMKEGMQVLDLRSPEAFAGASIPGSLSMPLDMVPAFAGWFLEYERPVGFVAEKIDDADAAARYLIRMGYDLISVFLDDGLHAWEVSARRYNRVPAIEAQEIIDRRERGDDFILLDVRKKDEYDGGRIPGAKHCYLGHLPGRLDELPQNKRITAFCGSGMRAVIAASILKNSGFDQAEVCLGSMAACVKAGCETTD